MAITSILKGAGKVGAGLLNNKSTFTGTIGALFAAEALKQGAFTPALNAVGIGRKAPATPPPAAPPGPAPATLQELVMYGDPGKAGLFGSSHPLLGGSAGSPGLLERRFVADDQFRNAQLQANLKSQQVSTGADVERQRLVSAAQTILGGQQAQRDMYSAKQNTMSNMSANMAVMVAGAGINVPTAYGQTMVQNTQALATPTSAPQQQAFGGRSPGFQRRGAGRRVGMGGYGNPMAGGGMGGYGGMM
jgi:hypothetical protein